MSAGKASIVLANAQALTNAYALTSVLGSFLVSEESLATLDITYTTGASETTAYLNFYVQSSYDGTNNWVTESVGAVSGVIDTLAPVTHKVAGGAGGTAYTAQYFLPTCSRYFRIYVKETSVSSNYGRLTMAVTMAAASGQSRNLQAVTVAVDTTGLATEAKQDDQITLMGAPTTLTGGEKVVTTAGTGVALGTTLATRTIFIRAKLTNTGNIYVGDSNVDKTTSQQVVLAAGDSVTLNIADRATVYVDSAVNLEGVDYVCLS